jgi:hypothetical protein
MASPVEIATVIEKHKISDDNACRLSQVSYSDARSEQRRWQWLVFGLGCVVVATVLAAVVLFMIDENTRSAAVVALLGTAVSSAGTVFVVKQRNDASIEKEKALDLVKKYCAQPKRTVEELDKGATPAELVVPMAQA